MIFKADKKVLSDAVANASKACAVKTTFNYLDGVLLSLKENKLTLTGYDLEMGIKVIIPVEGEKDGELIIDAKLFGDIIRKMPDNDMVEIIVSEEKNVKISSGKIKFEIQGASSANYPSIIELNDDISFDISEPVLKSMLSQVCHAIAQTDINPILMGALFEIENGVLYIVASDSTRLALRKENIDFKDITFIVPEKTVVEINRNLSEVADEKSVKIIIDKNQICFMKEDYIIFSRLIDGKFLDFKRIIDYKPERTAIIKVRETISALERCSLLITEKLKSPVICKFIGRGEHTCMNLHCKTSLGEINEDLFVNFEINIDQPDYENFIIAFNPKFMIEALKNSECDEVRVLFATELKPIKILPMSGDSFLFVVVPVRQKYENY